MTIIHQVFTETLISFILTIVCRSRNFIPLSLAVTHPNLASFHPLFTLRNKFGYLFFETIAQ